MIVNILFFSMSAQLAFEMQRASLSSTVVGGFAALALLSIILFGEIFPKSVALSSPRRFVRLVALPLDAIHRALRAVRFIALMEMIARSVEKRLSPDATNDPHLPPGVLSAVEIEHALNLSSDLSAPERDLLRRVVRLEDVAARELMTPRPQITYASVSDSPADALALAATQTFHDLPVAGDGIDDIRGFVTIDDLFALSKTGAASLDGLLKPFRLLPETMPASDILRRMSDEKYHTAIVVDEYGQTAGVITLEDCLEGIFGDMSDEFDSDIEPPKDATGDQFELQGDMSVRDWTDMFRVSLAAAGFDVDAILNDDFDTMSGFIVKQLQRLPQPDDRVVFDKVTFVIQEINEPGQGTPVKSFIMLLTKVTDRTSVRLTSKGGK
jgi:CBS domain containing-hemolysin-like protein